MLPYVDFFVPSVEELAFMIDRPLYREWVGRANGRDLTVVIRLQEIRALAETLISWGAGIVLLKCGTPGLYIAAGEGKNLKILSD